MLTTWENLAEQGQISEAILEYIRHYDYVSFAELSRRLEPFTETKGDFTLDIAPNVVIWAGLNDQLCSIIQTLLKEKKIFLYPANELIYLIDGGMLRFPIAKRPPCGGYREPHWLPVCLRVVPVNGKRVSGSLLER